MTNASKTLRELMEGTSPEDYEGSAPHVEDLKWISSQVERLLNGEAIEEKGANPLVSAASTSADQIELVEANKEVV